MLLRGCFWAIVLLTLCQAGCCCHHGKQRSACIAPGRDCLANSLFPVNRGSIDIDLVNLPDPSLETVGLAPQFADTDPYYALTEDECLSLAVTNSNSSSLLDSEGNAQKKRQKKRHHAGGQLDQSVFFFLGEEARNQSAGAALELYFRLAEAEAKWDLLQSSLEVLLEAQHEIRKIRNQGLKVTPEMENLERRVLQMQAERLKLRAAIVQLNSDLQSLLGLELCHGLLWPAADFGVGEMAIDCDEAVATGLAQRPELLLLRELSAGLTAENLPLVRRLLQAAHPMLGLVLKVEHPCLGWLACLGKIVSVLHPGKKNDELVMRRLQIDQLLQNREKAVAEEIRLAVNNLHTQTQLVAVAKHQTLQRGAKYRELEERRSRGLTSFLEVVPAKLDLFQANSDLVHEVMAWHIARVRLKKAQGIHE